MSLVALLLAGSDVLLAAAVLSALARPSWLARLLGRVEGLGEELDDGTLDWETEERLLRQARLLRAPMLLALFAWSFLTGALMSLSRL